METQPPLCLSSRSGEQYAEDDTSYDRGAEDDDGKNSQPRNEPLLAFSLLLIVLYLARNARLATLELSPDTICFTLHSLMEPTNTFSKIWKRSDGCRCTKKLVVFSCGILSRLWLMRIQPESCRLPNMSVAAIHGLAVLERVAGLTHRPVNGQPLSQFS